MAQSAYSCFIQLELKAKLIYVVSVRLCLHRGHGGCAEAPGPPPPGLAGAGVSAAPGRPPAGGTPPFNIAAPPTDCRPRADHFLQHQDPWRCSHAQTISGDAGSHDGLSLECGARKRKTTNNRAGLQDWTSVFFFFLKKKTKTKRKVFIRDLLRDLCFSF